MSNEKSELLQGLQVVDLTDLKGGFCPKILGDLGARVIKILNQKEDSLRDKGTSSNFRLNLLHLYINRNKQLIELDPEINDGRSRFLELIKTADVLVESSSHTFLEKVDFAPDKLQVINPGLIHVSISGFGKNGPYSGYKSCDLIASSSGGQMFINGVYPEPPINTFGDQSYYSASLYAVLAVLLALRKKNVTGIGEHIDLSIQEAITATLEHTMIQYFHDRTIPTRQGSRHWNNNFFISPCRDGFILMTIFRQWETLIEWLDSEGKAADLKDEKWQDEAYRESHSDHVIEVLEQWTMDHSIHELFETGQLMGFPWGPVLSSEQVLRSPQLKARDFFRTIEDPVSGMEMKCPGVPYRIQIGGKRPQENIRFSNAPQPNSHKGHDKILNGIRVLDLSRVLAGPYTTRILGDFGAEVIKIQTKKTSSGAESNNSPYFRHWNRNKLGIILDMARDEARELFLLLVEKCDILVENFTPRVMSNWGLNYEVLEKTRPDLIMLSLSGMGQTGPWKNFSVFGPTLHALSGMTHLTSYVTKKPIGPGNSYADIIAGLYGALTVLGGLEYREKTGCGMFIDLSEYEALSTVMGPAIMNASIKHEGDPSPEILLEQGQASPYGCYKCLGDDRWCTIAVFTEMEWQGFCQALGHPSWSERKEFASLEKRRENHEELNRFIEEWTSGKTAEQAVRLLQDEGVPAGIVQNAEDLFKDPQLNARKFFREIEYSLSGQGFTDTYPFRFGEDLEISLTSSPLMGEHNDYVFGELLGLDGKTISDFIEKGVIA